MRTILKSYSAECASPMGSGKDGAYASRAFLPLPSPLNPTAEYANRAVDAQLERKKMKGQNLNPRLRVCLVNERA